MNKRFLCLFLVFSFCLLCGCASNAADVKLSGKKELAKYTKEKYCDAVVIDYVEEEQVHTCYFKEEKTGIEFYVEARVKSIGIDASTLGYNEGKHSDFVDQYVDYLNGIVNTEVYGVSKIMGNNSMPGMDGTHELTVMKQDTDITVNQFIELSEEIRKNDVLGFFTAVKLREDSQTIPIKYSFEERRIVD